MREKFVGIISTVLLIEILLFILSLLIYGILEFVLGFDIYSSKLILIIRDISFTSGYLFFGLCALTFISQHFAVEGKIKIKNSKGIVKKNILFLIFFVIILYFSMLLGSILEIINNYTELKVPSFILELLSTFTWVSFGVAILCGLLHFVISKSNIKRN